MATGADASKRPTGHLRDSLRRGMDRAGRLAADRVRRAEHGLTHEHAVAGALPGGRLPSAQRPPLVRHRASVSRRAVPAVELELPGARSGSRRSLRVAVTMGRPPQPGHRARSRSGTQCAPGSAPVARLGCTTRSRPRRNRSCGLVLRRSERGRPRRLYSSVQPSQRAAVTGRAPAMNGRSLPCRLQMRGRASPEVARAGFERRDVRREVSPMNASAIRLLVSATRCSAVALRDRDRASRLEVDVWVSAHQSQVCAAW
jgi:hypothetical protein